MTIGARRLYVFETQHSVIDICPISMTSIPNMVGCMRHALQSTINSKIGNWHLYFYVIEYSLNKRK